MCTHIFSALVKLRHAAVKLQGSSRVQRGAQTGEALALRPVFTTWDFLSDLKQPSSSASDGCILSAQALQRDSRNIQLFQKRSLHVFQGRQEPV